MSSQYIGIKGPDQSGRFTAMLLPSTPSPTPDQNVRTITHWEDLEELKAEWGVEEVRGDDLVELAYSHRKQGGADS